MFFYPENGVRRRRILSKTTEASNQQPSNPQIYTDIFMSVLSIHTENNVINYFRSAANRINVFIFGHVRVAISRWRCNGLRKSSEFWKDWLKCFIFCHPRRETSLLHVPEMGSKWTHTVVYALHKWPLSCGCRPDACACRVHKHFLPFDEAIASRGAVFVIVSGSDWRKLVWSQLNNLKTVTDRPYVSMGS